MGRLNCNNTRFFIKPIQSSLRELIKDVINQTGAPSDDAEQIAGCMYIILESLDKNQRSTSDIQNEIITFLAEKGLCSESAVSTYTSLFRNIVCFLNKFD